MESVIQKIKQDKKWFKLVKQKARKRNILLDSMLKLDARYVLERDKYALAIDNYYRLRQIISSCYAG